MIESEQGKEIIVRHIGNHTCKYHRTCGNEFDIEHLGPKGLCLDLYSAAYPYCLGLLHGAEFSWMKKSDANSVYAQCPAPEPVHFQVERVPLEKIVENNGVKKSMKVIIRITRAEAKSGDYCNDCLCKQKVGQEFEFNQGDFNEYMCPAAFYNMYPVIRTILNGGEMPWTRDGKTQVQCPDNVTKIGFEIEKK